MKAEEYNAKVQDLKSEYLEKLTQLDWEYVEANKEFNVGDFIRNVTGIIKIDYISYEENTGVPQIRYIGKRYKMVHGVLSRTKDKSDSTLTYCLKKIENPRVHGQGFSLPKLSDILYM